MGRPIQSLTLCAYEVDAEPVSHASDEEQRLALGIEEADLACHRWEAEMLAGSIPASQALADRLIAAGYVGMRIRSYAICSSPDDINLIMWKWAASRPTKLTLIDDGRFFSATLRHPAVPLPELNSRTASLPPSRPPCRLVP